MCKLAGAGSGRFPLTLKLVPAAPVMPVEETVMLLKLCAPAPPIVLLAPSNIIVPLPPVNVPLLVQLPLTVCVLLPPLKVVELPMLTAPLKVILEAEVKETAVPDPMLLVKFPSTVKAIAGKVLVTDPEELLSVRLP
jgi:hypothetical protein